MYYLLSPHVLYDPTKCIPELLVQLYFLDRFLRGNFSRKFWGWRGQNILGKKKTFLRPTLMHTKNLYENGPNPFFPGFFDLI